MSLSLLLVSLPLPLLLLFLSTSPVLGGCRGAFCAAAGAPVRSGADLCPSFLPEMAGEPFRSRPCGRRRSGDAACAASAAAAATELARVCSRRGRPEGSLELGASSSLRALPAERPARCARLSRGRFTIAAATMQSEIKYFWPYSYEGALLLVRYCTARIRGPPSLPPAAGCQAHVKLSSSCCQSRCNQEKVLLRQQALLLTNPA